jgi:hypothetical protein
VVQGERAAEPALEVGSHVPWLARGVGGWTSRVTICPTGLSASRSCSQHGRHRSCGTFADVVAAHQAAHRESTVDEVVEGIDVTTALNGARRCLSCGAIGREAEAL